MTGAQSISRWLLILAAVAYAYGLFLGLLALGWELLFRDGLPKWEWWQYLLAPLIIGLVAMALEGLGTLLMKGDDVSHPTWKRALRIGVFFLVLTVIILGPAFYNIAHS